MLGRYVGGTLVVLGVAMLVAPDRKDAPTEPAPTESVSTDAATAASAPARPEAASRAATSRGDLDVRATKAAASALVQDPAPGAPQPEATRPGPAARDATGASAGAPADASTGDASALDADNATAAIVAAAVSARAPSRDGPSAMDGAAQTGATALRDARATPLPTLAEPETLREAAISDETRSLISNIENRAQNRGANRILPSEASAAAETPVRPVRYVTGSRVNVRAGPSTEYEVISSVVRGEAVEVVGDGAVGWSRIRLDGGATGFMASRFLSETPGG